MTKPSVDNRVDLALWVLFSVAVVTTTILSFGPSPPGANLFPGADKVLHAFAYFVTILLALLAGVWRPGRGPGPLADKALLLVAAAIAAGGLIEILQQFVLRDSSVFDWLAEIVGAVLALAIVRALSQASATPYPGRAADSRGASGA
jgi:VanZ family protein